MKPSQCSHLPTPTKRLCDSAGVLQHPEVRCKQLAHNFACDGTHIFAEVPMLPRNNVHHFSNAALTNDEPPASAARCSRAAAYPPVSWDRRRRCAGQTGRGRRLLSHSISEAGLRPPSSPENKTSDGPD